METSLSRNEDGAATVEFSLIALLLFVLTFGIAEGGYLMWQYNSAEKATQIGVRLAVVSPPVVTGGSDCGVGVTIPSTVLPGASCSTVSGASTWSVTCQNGSGAPCDTAAFRRIADRMREIYPRIGYENVVVQFRGAGLGFVGRGAPVPVVTVSLQNLTFNFIALSGLLGLGPITMPGFPATLTGEDLADGAGA